MLQALRLLTCVHADEMFSFAGFNQRQRKPKRDSEEMIFDMEVRSRVPVSGCLARLRAASTHPVPVPLQTSCTSSTNTSPASTPRAIFPLASPATVVKVWQWDSSYGLPSPNGTPNSPPASPIRAGYLPATTPRSCAGSPGSDSAADSHASPSANSLKTSPRAALALTHGRPCPDLSFQQEDCVLSEAALASVTVACQQEAGREQEAEKVIGLMDSLWFDGLP